MKKAVIGLALAALLLGGMAMPAAAATKSNPKPGGVGGFFIGCCLGLRVGLEWNEGAETHWREWFRLIPYIGLIFGIWDGIECAQGKTAHDFAKEYGTNWY